MKASADEMVEFDGHTCPKATLLQRKLDAANAALAQVIAEHTEDHEALGEVVEMMNEMINDFWLTHSDDLAEDMSPFIRNLEAKLKEVAGE